MIWIAVLLVVALSAATVMGFAARWGWPFELTSHLRWQYAVALLLLTLLLLGLRRPAPATWALLFALVNVGQIAPLYLAAPPSPRAAAASATAVSAASPSYRAVMINVHWTNQDVEPVLAYLRETDPDFFVLVEVTAAWEEALQPLIEAYPYVSDSRRLTEHGVMVYSRVPFVAAPQRLADGERPSVIAQLAFPERPLTVVGVHPPAPVSPHRMQLRNAQIATLANTLPQMNTPLLLLGDLNMTPWSAVFTDFLQQTGLRNGRDGFGVQTTWPAQLPLLSIPIDHALVSAGVQVQQFSAGPSLSSDHRPIVIDFALTQPSPQAH